MEQSGEDDKGAKPAAAPEPKSDAPAPKGLLGALQNATADVAPSQLSASHLQGATPSTLDALAPEAKATLGQLLTNAGAAQGAGVTDTTDSHGLSQMLSWVQSNIPGGLPGALGALGVAGGAAVAAEESGEGSNLLDQVQNIGGGLLKSVLGSVMPAINQAVTKATTKDGQ